jgi:serine/threonine-protein kinase
MVEIPNIYKKTMEDARKTLEDIGFTVIVYQEYHSTVEKGLVYSVTPSIGSEIADDSEVTIHISMGPDPDKLNEEKYSTLPNLVGKTRFEAERLIAEAGLTLGTIKEIYSDTFEYGKVCEMSLKPGKVTMGTVINITISLGPETFFPAN